MKPFLYTAEGGSKAWVYCLRCSRKHMCPHYCACPQEAPLYRMTVQEKSMAGRLREAAQQEREEIEHADGFDGLLRAGAGLEQVLTDALNREMISMPRLS